MLNSIVFDFEDQMVRFVGSANKPEWIAKDVCTVLGIKDPSMALSRFKDHERGTTTIGTPGGTQTVLTVYESGLYRLIFTSRKPEAERFKDWVFGVVLPQIRKTGKYGGDKVRGKLPKTKEISLERLLEMLRRWYIETGRGVCHPNGGSTLISTLDSEHLISSGPVLKNKLKQLYPEVVWRKIKNKWQCTHHCWNKQAQ